jgi:5-methyltetrahydropteroyltriglutamate--homocysteine methyltransferase
MDTIYRAEVIGSLLRPAYLNEARAAMLAGTLGEAEFKRLEDHAVDECLAMQERIGLDVVTDGEMRRTIYLVPGSGTMRPAASRLSRELRWRRKEGEATAEERARVPFFPITSKLRFTHSACAAEFAYAQAHTRKPLKVTMPGPTTLLNRWSPEYSAAVYPDPISLLADAVDAIRQEVRELAALGCSYVQIDAPELSSMVDEERERDMARVHPKLPGWFRNEGIEALNAVASVPGVKFGLHVCRGNYKGFWLSEAPWEALARQIFPRTTNFDIFLLEYDDWRSGSFAPLADLGRDKIAVLGLVSTKRSELEPVPDLIQRIGEAARFFPREQLAISSQCGFSPDATSNTQSAAGQEAKLRLVVEIARRVWG